MKAILRSVRIAPKKAGLIAKMIRGKSVPEALTVLEQTNKKAARLLEDLLRSAMANASHNDKQKPEDMIITSLVVNKAQSFFRGYPMARGRQRVYRNFLSHITLQLGYLESALGERGAEKKPKQKASQSPQKTVQKGASTASKATKASETKSDTKTKKTSTQASSTKKKPSSTLSDKALAESDTSQPSS
ncbi:50S ribosomal protein L22 [Candidatus Peregrinibacteria bacterium CG10_big_fil_rev_8_21_14_0_10_49_10]|nr:MAG: 50S ribosomal protein L22 [Candidatus Peregrinibacteria bacterium CG10_big_fil_rev_8_21_14_0_10_49_10]